MRSRRWYQRWMVLNSCETMAKFSNSCKCTIRVPIKKNENPMRMWICCWMSANMSAICFFPVTIRSTSVSRGGSNSTTSKRRNCSHIWSINQLSRNSYWWSFNRTNKRWTNLTYQSLLLQSCHVYTRGLPPISSVKLIKIITSTCLTIPSLKNCRKVCFESWIRSAMSSFAIQYGLMQKITNWKKGY